MTDPELQQKRLIAAAIDVGVLVVVSTILSMGAIVINCVASASNVEFLATYGAQIILVLVLLADLLLVLGRDLTGGDRSLGKKLMNIRVVRASGEPISFMESVKRNALFAPGLAIGLLTALLGLIPFVGCVAACLFLIPRIIAGLAALGAVVWEVVQIIQQPDGVRVGDKMADTRVTW
jgi:uncharacterized RDD family membrane protein YckC